MNPDEELTVKECAKLFVGADKWHVRGFPEKGVPGLKLADGPSGLRIEKSNALGFPESVEAVAYPCACALACSFDPQLMKELGKRLAEECRRYNVDILLGPGVNHKRSPLCGRNFEYFSEDPILSSELASAYIEGLQENGIGTSLKHFAGHSRETARMVENSVIDQRTLHELYLRQFERTVRKAQPWTVMAAYNRLNGKYCTENKKLLQQKLRKEWGYKGIVVSDWGALSDPVKALNAGTDLEMPGGDHGTSDALHEGISEGKLSADTLRQSSARMLALMEKCAEKKAADYDEKEHYAFAEELAERSIVLLKNEGMLPLDKEEKIAVIGAFAEHPRFQGTGSSKVNCPDHDCLLDALEADKKAYSYAQGYHLLLDTEDPLLSEQAVLMAKACRKAVIMIGLPEGKEAEGYDRENMKLPASQNRLIERICEVFENVTVVLQCGAPVEMPWAEKVQGIVMAYLSGCRGGEALKRILYGEISPSGKLAESFPLVEEDVPCVRYFRNDIFRCEYREGIYSGYRYYSSFSKPVRYPFGHGLSYTAFVYRDLQLRKEEKNVVLSLFVRNSGKRKGRETVQIYAALPQSRIARPLRELKAFRSVELDPGEEKQIEMKIALEDLKYYDVLLERYELEEGVYRFEAASSSEDIRLVRELFLPGYTFPCSTLKQAYLREEEGMVTVSDADFAAMLGTPPTTEERKRFTRDSIIFELGSKRLGRAVHRFIDRYLRRRKLHDVSRSMVFESPLRMMLMASDRFTWKTVDVIADLFNGHLLGFFRRLLKSIKGK